MEAGHDALLPPVLGPKQPQSLRLAAAIGARPLEEALACRILASSSADKVPDPEAREACKSEAPSPTGQLATEPWVICAG